MAAKQMPRDAGVELLFLERVFAGQQAKPVLRHAMPQRALLVTDRAIAFAQAVDPVGIDFESDRAAMAASLICPHGPSPSPAELYNSPANNGDV